MTWKSVLFDKNSNDIKPHVTKMSKSLFFFFKYVYVTFVKTTFIKFIQMQNNVIIQFFILLEMKNEKRQQRSLYQICFLIKLLKYDLMLIALLHFINYN